MGNVLDLKVWASRLIGTYRRRVFVLHQRQDGPKLERAILLHRRLVDFERTKKLERMQILVIENPRLSGNHRGLGRAPWIKDKSPG